ADRAIPRCRSKSQVTAFSSTTQRSTASPFTAPRVGPFSRVIVSVRDGFRGLMGDSAKDRRRVMGGDVRFDRGSRAAYATDASNYRQVPIGVVLPRDAADVVAAMDVCRQHDAPVLPRGGGTSLAGQCCNVAVVFDFTKYMRRLVVLDPEPRRPLVEPGLRPRTL